ncbi:MAG: peptidoglycan-binding protein [Desertimonas sp.]
MSIRFPARRRFLRSGVTVALAAGITLTGASVVDASPTPSVPSAPAAPNVVGLEYGARGPAVVALQEALVRVGVGVRYGVDGYFGSATRASVKAWQTHKGLPSTGVVDAATAQSLGLTTQTPAASTSATAAATSTSSSGNLVLGNRGPRVANLQLALINNGYVPTGGVDGIFGAATQAQVRRYQQAKGLSVTGVADAATQQSLGLAAGASSNSPAASTTSSPSGQLARGARGANVAAMQQALINAGFPVAGGADGVFGPATEASLKRFQASRGLEQTGSLGPQTTTALGLDGSTPAPAVAATPATATAAASSYVGLRYGSTGPAVVALQKAIGQLGWYVRGGADGVYGVATQAVVKAVQRANGISATGVVDAATARLLGLTGSAPTAQANTPTAGGSTAAGFAVYDERGSRVVALQQALIRAGISFNGGADGAFGSATLNAIRQFQQGRGLSVSGKVDAATAAALGLSASNAPAPTTTAAVALQAKPVGGRCYYGDTWGAARSNGRVHLGVDILAAEGTPLQAVVTGRVTQIYTDRPGSLSGNGLKIATADGTYFFYAHLQSLAPGIQVGSSVSAGQVVGYVGKTGNTLTPHLHLEIHPGGGSAVNPYPIVKQYGAC